MDRSRPRGDDAVDQVTTVRYIVSINGQVHQPFNTKVEAEAYAYRVGKRLGEGYDIVIVEEPNGPQHTA
jgi:hypothetical protein